MFKARLIQAMEGNSLTEREMEEAMEALLEEAVPPLQVAAFLAALRARGETPEEITGAVRLLLRLPGFRNLAGGAVRKRERPPARRLQQQRNRVRLENRPQVGLDLGNLLVDIVHPGLARRQNEVAAQPLRFYRHRAKTAPAG